MSAPTPEPLYYLHNFRRALRWVMERSGDLLTKDEINQCQGFWGLPEASQALLVRLISRKGIHFRLSKLNYPELGDLHKPIEVLCQRGWLSQEAVLDVAEITDILLKAEIASHLPKTGLHASAKKADVVEALIQKNLTPRLFNQWCTGLNDTVVSVTASAWADLIRLLFFGNLAQQWSEFVLADLGIYRYENVAFTQQSRGFQSRQDVDDYLYLRTLREDFYQEKLIPELLPKLLGFDSANQYLKKRQSRLLFSIAQSLEKAGNTTDALPLYEQSHVGEARWRQIRILEQQGQWLMAYQKAEHYALEPVNDEERQRLTRALTRLAKKLGKAAPAKPKAIPESAFSLTLPYTRSVELAVREHLARENAPVYYVENALFTSLFGLLCWDAIFAPVPGAFFHPFHTGPVDLYAEDFFEKRQSYFAECLNRLDSTAYIDIIKQRFADKFGIQSPFVFWGLLDEPLLDMALSCIAPKPLKAIFLRLLQDLKANRTGMPDLIQFYPHTQSFRLIEVKGPGDRLQDNQKRWLAFAAENGIHVDVCYVSWSNDDL